MQADSFIPLRSVELDILLSVADRPRHGYGILKDAEKRLGRRPGFRIPTLYRALRRMRDMGLVRSLASRAGEHEDERRQYWQATSLGMEVLRAELVRLEGIVAEGNARVSQIAGESA